MHRIDTPTAQKDKFGAGKNGFTRGNPQTASPATDLDDDYFDMLQEELAGVVEATGVSLDKAKRNQLLTALKALLLTRAHPFADIKADGATAVAEALANLGFGTRAWTSQDYIRIPDIPGGVIIQWGYGPQTSAANQNPITIPFPIPFPNTLLATIIGTTGVDNTSDLVFQGLSGTTSSIKVLPQVFSSASNSGNASPTFIAIGR